jgi:hypothetical protein
MYTCAQLATAASKEYKPYMEKKRASTLSISLPPLSKKQATTCAQLAR